MQLHFKPKNISYPSKRLSRYRVKLSPKHLSVLGSSWTVSTGMRRRFRVDEDKRRWPYSNEYSTMYCSSTIEYAY